MKLKKIFSIIIISIIIFCLAFFSILCTKDNKPKEENSKPMKGALSEIFEIIKNKTEVITLGKEDGPLMLITPERGAKILGLSFNGLKGQNLLWIPNEMLADSFWTKPMWNMGGARSWISPEDRFYLDQNDVWIVPNQMDPGKYVKEKSDKDGLKCSNTFSIKSKDGKDYSVKLTREIKILDAVPQNLKKDNFNFKYAGFQFTHELENLSKEIIGKDIPYMGLWSLIQLPANGTMIIPIKKVKDPRGENYRNYFNVFPPERISPKDDNITVKMDGKFRGKLGIAPWAAKEKLAYLYNTKDGNGILFIKEFAIDPEGKYLDKPWGKPSGYGDAVQMYNDDGMMGGFCEMECHAAAKEIKQGEKISHSIVFSVFEGKISELKKYLESILELSPASITYYE